MQDGVSAIYITVFIHLFNLVDAAYTKADGEEDGDWEAACAAYYAPGDAADAT